MGRVRQAGTAPEEAVAQWLRAHGLRYRRNVRTLPGRPDFANQRAGFAIFVHGCFWHRHPGCPRTTTPSRNRAFWLEKFAANLARDAARTTQLKQLGLQTITVWECETEDGDLLASKLGPLLAARSANVAPRHAESGE
jgi:DNA mismatch endonuclease (patch repair protein)